MNKTLALVLTGFISTSSLGWGTAAAPTPVPTGNLGIADNILARSVTVRVEPGRVNGSTVSGGRFVGEVVYVQPQTPAGSFPMVTRPTLRIYRLDFVSNPQGGAARETLIYNSPMGRLSIAPAAPRAGDQITESFAINAINISNQQGSLLRPGELYRAEIVVERGLSGQRVFPGFEAAAGDVLFWMSEFRVPVSTVRGEISVSATNTPNKNATAQQRQNLIAREIQEFNKATSAIRGLLDRHGAASKAGEAPRAGWTWRGGAVQQIWPPRNNTSYVVSGGEVYTTQKTTTTTAFNTAAKNLTKTYTIPGGTVRVTVRVGLTFTDVQR